jgi:hypothetical protein
VTFASGSVLRELLVALDDERRRLVYAIPEGPFTTYSASVEVLAEKDRRSRVVWIIDMLPDNLADYINGQVDEAVKVMRKTLPQGAADPAVSFV